MENRPKPLTCNGQCSRCGNCCMPVIPLTIAEYKKIKTYILKNNITKVNPFDGNNFYCLCPFYDRDNKCCKIYSVRPAVCRDFKCDLPLKVIEDNRIYYDKIADINGNHSDRFIPLDLLFYDDPTITLMYATNKFGANTEEKLKAFLYLTGKDQKFLKKFHLPNTHDILEGIASGNITFNEREDD